MNKLIIFGTSYKEMFSAIQLFLKGITLGLMVSVPLGPIGMLLITRTIKRGVMAGFLSGLGLAVADTILAFIAALGFTIIISFIKEESFIIGLLSGILIIGVGVKVFFSTQVDDFRKKENGSKSLWRDFISVFALSITNPFTIFVFIAYFSGINIGYNIDNQFIPLIIISGVFTGALAWWWMLSFFVHRFKKKLSIRNLIKINKVAGIIIIAIGIIILVTLFMNQNQNVFPS